MLPVRIKSEAWVEKGPALSLADMSPSVARPDRPVRHAAQVEDLFLKGVEVVATIREAPARKEIDDAIEEARRRVIAVPDGGNIAIDETRALTAIDVDGGDRRGAGEAFALKLNLSAADEAARQIALRGLAGLVALDCLRMEAKRDQRAVVAAFRASLATWLGRASEVLEISPLGVCEAAIARRSRPLRTALAAAPGEREALDALREIESAGWTDRGGRIHARVSLKAATWLAADEIGWKKQLADHIGARWTLETEDRPPGPPKVWSTR
jgi:ribonuclease E